MRRLSSKGWVGQEAGLSLHCGVPGAGVSDFSATSGFLQEELQR
jgi:hypothetical protein